eukprot:1147635-Pelagomonas_calceolata.AAC.9
MSGHTLQVADVLHSARTATATPTHTHLTLARVHVCSACIQMSAAKIAVLQATPLLPVKQHEWRPSSHRTKKAIGSLPAHVAKKQIMAQPNAIQSPV